MATWQIGSDGDYATHAAFIIGEGQPSGDDHIQFKCGEVFREQVSLGASGTSGHNIVYETYGSGANPVITGTELASGFDEALNELTADGNTVGLYNFESDLTDDSGNSRDLTETGTFTYSNSGAPFDYYAILTSGDRASYSDTESGDADAFDFGTGTSFTIEAWINRQSNTGWATVASKGSNGTVRYELLFNGSTNVARAYAYDGTNSLTVDGTTAITDSNWHHIAGVWDWAGDGKIHLYVDGTSEGTPATLVDTLDNAYDFTIGSQTNGTNQFLGQIEQVKISNIAVSSFPSSTGEDIWKKTSVTTEPKVVLFDGAVGKKEAALDDLDSALDWYWASDVLYVYSTSDPDTAYSDPGIEIGQRNYCLNWDGQSYLEFNNIDFWASNSYNIFIDGNGTNILFDGCGIYGSYTSGLNHHAIDSLSYVTIQNCDIAYNGALGIAVTSNTNNWLIQDNVFYNNGFTYEGGAVENTWGGGIKLTGSTCIDHIVQDNEFYYNGYKDSGSTRVYAGSGKGHGCWLDLATVGSGDGSIIRRNKCHHNADSGLFCEKSTYHEIYYNLSYSNADHGLRVDADEDGPAVSNNKFYNNTIYGNTGSGIMIAGGWAATGNRCSNNELKNNISVGNGTQEFEAKWGGENDGTYGSGNVYTYNCFGTEASNFIEWGEDVYKSTYDDWEDAYGGSTYSVESDPLFVNAADANFRRYSNCPCQNAGTDLSLTEDYYGNPPAGDPDVGAYEGFNVSPSLGAYS